ncbi:hypothetical protein I5907_17640 [Panacibacter sp. DH6]|uniref:Uncharacterized protein n=1 Tax=Panacibacter microcysteis TaxID=2793269 RepID=A0A931MCF7_9BACT|nr:hypothetical protein [Panacibacter microcysteis]MBG9378065.1 hypothetical protein [Panacibacter microcysteis]
MKKLLFAGMLLITGAAFAISSDKGTTGDFSQYAFNNIKDTVPQDTSDTTHKPDSIFLANILDQQ